MVKHQNKGSALYHNETPTFIYIDISNKCLFLSEFNHKDCRRIIRSWPYFLEKGECPIKFLARAFVILFEQITAVSKCNL